MHDSHFQMHEKQLGHLMEWGSLCASSGAVSVFLTSIQLLCLSYSLPLRRGEMSSLSSGSRPSITRLDRIYRENKAQSQVSASHPNEAQRWCIWCIVVWRPRPEAEMRGWLARGQHAPTACRHFVPTAPSGALGLKISHATTITHATCVC